MCLWCQQRDGVGAQCLRFLLAPESRTPCPSVAQTQQPEHQKETHSFVESLLDARHGSSQPKSSLFPSKHGMGPWEPEFRPKFHCRLTLWLWTSRITPSVSFPICKERVLGQMPPKSPFRSVEPFRILKALLPPPTLASLGAAKFGKETGSKFSSIPVYWCVLTNNQ